MKIDLTKLSDEELQELEDASMRGVDPHKYTLGNLLNAIDVGIAVSAELSRRQRAKLLEQEKDDYSHLVADLF